MISSHIKGNEKHFKDTDMLVKNQSASIKNLEIQMGQLTNLLSNRAQGSFPSDTKKNPREHVNAIMLRNKTQYAEPKVKV